MSINCTVSHNDLIKSLGTRTAEELLILSQGQCDEGGCHMTVTSPALWHGSWASFSNPSHAHNLCPTVSQDSHKMGFYFPSVRLMGLTVQGGVMAKFCIWALLHLSRNILRMFWLPGELSKLLHPWKPRTMVLESKIKILELLHTLLQKE